MSKGALASKCARASKGALASKGAHGAPDPPPRPAVGLGAGERWDFVRVTPFSARAIDVHRDPNLPTSGHTWGNAEGGIRRLTMVDNP